MNQYSVHPKGEAAFRHNTNVNANSSFCTSITLHQGPIRTASALLNAPPVQRVVVQSPPPGIQITTDYNDEFIPPPPPHHHPPLTSYTHTQCNMQSLTISHAIYTQGPIRTASALLNSPPVQRVVVQSPPPPGIHITTDYNDEFMVPTGHGIKRPASPGSALSGNSQLGTSPPQVTDSPVLSPEPTRMVGGGPRVSYSTDTPSMPGMFSLYLRLCRLCVQFPVDSPVLSPEPARMVGGGPRVSYSTDTPAMPGRSLYLSLSLSFVGAVFHGPCARNFPWTVP